MNLEELTQIVEKKLFISKLNSQINKCEQDITSFRTDAEKWSRIPIIGKYLNAYYLRKAEQAGKNYMANCSALDKFHELKHSD